MNIDGIDIVEYNRKAWDRLVAEAQDPWTLPVSSEEVAKARKGQVNLTVSAGKLVPQSWYPNLKGCRALCLASGGGQQGPLLAAAGADVTVFDNSPRQLERDREAYRSLAQAASVDLPGFAFRRSSSAILHSVSASNAIAPPLLADPSSFPE